MTTNTDVEKLLQGMQKKYLDLVWHARKAPQSDQEYWAGVPEDIKQGALNCMSRVEEMFPYETDALGSPEVGNFAHGFNSGALAVLRLIDTATKYGVDEARAHFPELDT